MVRISQEIYKQMKDKGLLEPEVVKGENGKVLRFKEKETGKYNKVVNKKVQVVNKGKKSKQKGYYIEQPIWDEFIKTIG